jgi:hypothetical protein
MKNLGMIFMIATAFLSSGFSIKESWLIHSDSRLTIHGSTNISNFTCKIDDYNGSDTLVFVKEASAAELHFLRNRMTIPVRSFDCGGRQISRDFWQTLKAETYPRLNINFRSLENLSNKDHNIVKGVVDITLAGTTARYTICYRVTRKDNVTVLLNGSRIVNFSDFNLEAPEKLNGLIKVNQSLNVEFNLVLKAI